ADAADVHDHAAFGLSLHDGVGVLREMQGAEQVQAHHGLRETWRRAGSLGRWRSSGVVDGDVESAEVFDGHVDHAFHLVGVAHVGHDEHRFAAVGNGQGVGPVTAADDDVGARFEEAVGDDAAYAAASAGDDHGLAGEVQWVRHSQASRTTVAPKSNRLSESV